MALNSYVGYRFLSGRFGDKQWPESISYIYSSVILGESIVSKYDLLFK